MAKGGLGKGLGVLLNGATAETGSNVDFREIALSKIVPNPNQPRIDFPEERIQELESSIKKDGLLQPILVRPLGDGFEIIAGERRWQACKRLGKESIPAKVLILSDIESQQMALVENLQRENLNPLEEARGYKRLVDLSGWKQKEVAEAVSKSSVAISNSMRLLDLPEDVQDMMLVGQLSAGHGRAILSLSDEEARIKLGKKIVEENLTVRDAENIARLYTSQGIERTKRSPSPRSFGIAARKLRKYLNTGVRIKTVRGKNKIEITFLDENELERILAAIEDGGALLQDEESDGYQVDESGDYGASENGDYQEADEESSDYEASESSDYQDVDEESGDHQTDESGNFEASEESSSQEYGESSNQQVAASNFPQAVESSNQEYTESNFQQVAESSNQEYAESNFQQVGESDAQ